MTCVVLPETLTAACVSENIAVMAATTSGKSATTRRVRQNRATAGLIRVGVEVPTQDDALAVRRFSRVRRRAGEMSPPPSGDAAPVSTATDIATALPEMDAGRQEIVLLFAQALAQTAEPDMLARGRRVALNFAEAVAQRWQDMALRDHDGPQ